MSIGIYKITNLVNQKAYIGQSIHIETRWLEHCRKSSKSLVAQAIQKYGKENFSFQILEECPKEELNAKEATYIKQYDTLVPNGYNIIEIDNQGKNIVFNKYTYETLMDIVRDLKENQLSMKEIATRYEIDLSMVYYLNRGDYHTLEGETYPLRPVQDLSKKEYFCIDCGSKVAKGSIRCAKCSHLAQHKCVHPTREELKLLIRTKPFTQIGKEFGVSDNTVRKWCITENLPNKKSDIKKYSDDDWQKL